MAKNNTLTYRVEQLEKEFCSLDKKIDDLLVNGIPHIHRKLTRLDTKMNVVTCLNVGAIILGVVFAYLITR